jgi:hypothetical protein
MLMSDATDHLSRTKRKQKLTSALKLWQADPPTQRAAASIAETSKP